MFPASQTRCVHERHDCAGAWRVQRCACVHARCSQNGLSDPYVKLTLRGVTKRSKVIAKTLTPVWAQEFMFRGTRQALASEPLQLVAYDHDAYSLNDQIGSGSVALHALARDDDDAAPRPTSGGAIGTGGGGGDSASPGLLGRMHFPAGTRSMAVQLSSPGKKGGESVSGGVVYLKVWWEADITTQPSVTAGAAADETSGGGVLRIGWGTWALISALAALWILLVVIDTRAGEQAAAGRSAHPLPPHHAIAAAVTGGRLVPVTAPALRSPPSPSPPPPSPSPPPPRALHAPPPSWQLHHQLFHKIGLAAAPPPPHPPNMFDGWTLRDVLVSALLFLLSLCALRCVMVSYDVWRRRERLLNRLIRQRQHRSSSSYSPLKEHGVPPLSTPHYMMPLGSSRRHYTPSPTSTPRPMSPLGWSARSGGGGTFRAGEHGGANSPSRSSPHRSPMRSPSVRPSPPPPATRQDAAWREEQQRKRDAREQPWRSPPTPRPTVMLPEGAGIVSTDSTAVAVGPQGYHAGRYPTSSRSARQNIFSFSSRLHPSARSAVLRYSSFSENVKAHFFPWSRREPRSDHLVDDRGDTARSTEPRSHRPDEPQQPKQLH